MKNQEIQEIHEFQEIWNISNSWNWRNPWILRNPWSPFIPWSSRNPWIPWNLWNPWSPFIPWNSRNPWFPWNLWSLWNPWNLWNPWIPWNPWNSRNSRNLKSPFPNFCCRHLELNLSQTFYDTLYDVCYAQICCFSVAWNELLRKCLFSRLFSALKQVLYCCNSSFATKRNTLWRLWRQSRTNLAFTIVKVVVVWRVWPDFKPRYQITQYVLPYLPIIFKSKTDNWQVWTFWNISEPFSTIWNLLQLFGTFENLSKPFITFQNLSKPFITFHNLS